MRCLIWAPLLLFSAPALAHDAPHSFARPNGWSYPFACCSGVDCRPVDASAVLDTDGGYSVPSGETIGSRDSRVKDSPDGLYHWCTVGGDPHGRTICLFVPPRGM